MPAGRAGASVAGETNRRGGGNQVAAEHDDWVRSVFGVDVADYAPASAPAPAPAPAPVQGVRTGGAAAPAAPGQTPFLTEPGDKTDVSESDIHQGATGDCFLLSSMGEIARIDPALIKKMITPNGDGSYTVTLHRQDNGITNLWGLFSNNYTEVKVRVTPDPVAGGVNAGAGQSVGADGTKEIWPQLLEKAYAQVSGGMAAINKGGRPEAAMQTLTGHDADYVWAKDAKYADVKQAFDAGKPITMDTLDDDHGKKKLPFGLHGGHAYMVEKIDTGPDGKPYVHLKNPWGFDDPQPIPFDRLPAALQTVSTGALH